MTKDTQTVWQLISKGNSLDQYFLYNDSKFSWKMTEICICLESLESPHLIISWPHLQTKLTPSNQHITAHPWITMQRQQKDKPHCYAHKEKGVLWWVHYLLSILAINISYQRGCPVLSCLRPIPHHHHTPDKISYLPCLLIYCSLVPLEQTCCVESAAGWRSSNRLWRCLRKYPQNQSCRGTGPT